MSNLMKLEFVALDISGKNYLTWILDAEIHLNAKDLGNTIKERNEASLQDRLKAMIFLHHLLYEGLKSEYLKDFKIVNEYNSTMFKTVSQLRLCGDTFIDEDMLEKTFTTFHASNMLLQQQYREKRFTKYSQLISCLLVAEQNNELLVKNHNSHPIGSKPFPEANASNHGRGQGGSYGRGHYNFRNRGGHNHASNKKSAPYHQKWNDNEEKQGKGKEPSGTFDHSYGDGNTNVGDENMKDGDDDANDRNPNID
ncbi:uncharacterized protein LOC109950313 [Prunus persica]|uniref:uncharacterized protein LOC109950313 n=1 Tax=Prunus persica TaxID=3760 RepID=UPI0009AB8023|nr:uncharacterized protein LOC109950313 [Prunus persica]